MRRLAELQLAATVKAAKVQAPAELPQPGPRAATAPSLGLVTISDLQNLYSLSKAEKDALAKRLQRWRPRHIEDWIEDQNAKSHKARFSYRLEAILPKIEQLIGSERVGQTSFDK